MRSPIVWFGGKGRLTGKLLPLLPPHEVYVEPFGGGASMLFAKAPSRLDVYNDIDQTLANLFRVLRDPAKFRRFRRLVEATPYCRGLWLESRRVCKTAPSDVMRAYHWFVANRQGFAGTTSAWGYSRTSKSRQTSKWIGTVQGLPQVHARLMDVQIDCRDWRVILDAYDGPRTVFYLDPPYVPATRKSGGYEHELTEADHVELAERLLRLDGMALLSGYRHDVYDPLERAGWRRVDFEVPCNAVGRTRAAGTIGKGTMRQHRRIESVWLNRVSQRALQASRSGHAPR